VLVVIVVYLFLQSWRATAHPLLAVPVSLSAHSLSSLCSVFRSIPCPCSAWFWLIGLVVDDAIVVVEAVEHNMEKGLSAREASIKAMQDVSGPVIAIALILAAVFIPTAFIPASPVVYISKFAVTICDFRHFLGLQRSYAQPALSALLLKPRKKVRGPLGRFFDWFNQVFGRATDGYITYAKSCHSALYDQLGCARLDRTHRCRDRKETSHLLLAEEDQGYLFISMQLPEAASLQRTGDAAANVEKIIEDTPGWTAWSRSTVSTCLVPPRPRTMRSSSYH